MPMFNHGEAQIHYEVRGEGFPVLLIAPGGMNSALALWDRTPWNPIDHLAPHYKVVAMDQRNAGQSTGPLSADDGWHTYTQDQLALMDHLGAERFHVAGMCIGGAYIANLLKTAPERIASAIMFQPIGFDNNRQAFFDMFDRWAQALQDRHPHMDEAAWSTFRASMYSGDFLFSASRDFIAGCTAPLLVMMGNDLYHPQSTSREIAALAPNATLVEHWKPDAHHPKAKQAIESFLTLHTPR